MSKDQNLGREAEARFFRGPQVFFELLCTVTAGIVNTLWVIVATHGLFLVSIRRMYGNFGMTSNYLRDHERKSARQTEYE